jgi:hypothetical protein
MKGEPPLPRALSLAHPLCIISISIIFRMLPLEPCVWGYSYQGAADMLTKLALEKGSRDNVTVVIIEFVWAPPLPPPQEGRTRSRHQYAVPVPRPALRKRAA